MIQDAIVNYVSSERAKGTHDSLIHSELIKSGWNEADITECLRKGTESPPSTIDQPGEKRLRLAIYLAITGNTILVVGIFMLWKLLSSPQSSIPAVMPFALFLITSLLLTPAMLFLTRSFRHAFLSRPYRVWAWILSFIMFTFVPFTVYFFVLHTFAPNRMHFSWSNDVVPLNFFILLPLQVMAYLLAVVTLLYQRYALRKHGLPITLPQMLWGFMLMFLASILGMIALMISIFFDS